MFKFWKYIKKEESKGSEFRGITITSNSDESGAYIIIWRKNKTITYKYATKNFILQPYKYNWVYNQNMYETHKEPNIVTREMLASKSLSLMYTPNTAISASYGTDENHVKGDTKLPYHSFYSFNPFNERRMLKTMLIDNELDLLEEGDWIVDSGKKDIMLIKFNDAFDNEAITGHIIAQQETYRVGRKKGIFKLLGYIMPKKTTVTIWVRFDKEIGKDKGSYKGGTVGTFIPFNEHKHHTILDAVVSWGRETNNSLISYRFLQE